MFLRQRKERTLLGVVTNFLTLKQQDMFSNHSRVSSSTGSDPEPGEEVRGSHDTQRQDRRRTDGGKL